MDIQDGKNKGHKGVKVRKVKVYYAHSRLKYGTKIEEYEINLIKETIQDAEIINPATDIDLTGTEEEILDRCFRAISECDLVVFSSIDGSIGHGTYSEVMHAQELAIPIRYINRNMLTAFHRYSLVEWAIKDDWVYASVYNRTELEG